MGGGGFGGGADFSDIFGDVFGDIFGGGRGRQRAARGADLRYNMELTLEEAVRGVTKEIAFRLWKSVTFATVAVQNQVHSRRPVRPVMVLARCRCARVSLPCSRPVHTVRAAVR